MRNQWLNAPQENPTSSKSGGSGLGCGAHSRAVHEELPGWLMSLVREATMKVCGVVVAMPQGHNWAPRLSSGWRVNVGTTSSTPAPSSIQLDGG